MILTDQQIIEYAKTPANSEAIKKASELQDVHKVHVTGDGYKDYIKQIIGYENNEQYAQKKELAEPVTTVLTKRIIDEQSRWKNTSGPKQFFEFKKNLKKDKVFHEVLSQVWKGESMDYFINNFFNDAMYTEFNGFLLVEQGRIEEEDGVVYEIRDGVKSIVKDNKVNPYIIFRPIEKVRDFKSKGNRVEYIILDWGKIEIDDQEFQLYRCIDDAWDRIVIIDNDEGRVLDQGPYKKIKNPLGRVNAIQVSTIKHEPIVDEVKTSYIWQTIPLLKSYLTNWAEHVITCILHSHPIYYQMGQMCRYKEGDNCCDGGTIYYEVEGQPAKKTCPACKGVGASITKDASTMIALPQVDEQGQAYSIANVAGYVAPPVEAIKMQIDELNWIADQVLQSGTGMNKVMETQIEKTATEAMLNYKPLEKIIGDILSNIEYVRTALTDMIGELYFKDVYQKSQITYIRQLNLRDENTVLIEIEQAKNAGASASYVRTLHDELIQSRYQNSPIELERNMMLSMLEPFIGYTPEEMSKYFDGFIDRETMVMKVYFTDYIVKFELENGLITDYQEDRDMNKRIEDIRKVLQKYNKAMLKKIGPAKVADSNPKSPGEKA